MSQLNYEFLEAHLYHLDRNRVMLVEGAAGSGKSALVEEIAMLYISGGGCKLKQREGSGKI
jgi:predicted ATPase